MLFQWLDREGAIEAVIALIEEKGIGAYSASVLIIEKGIYCLNAENADYPVFDSLTSDVKKAMRKRV